MNETEDGYDDVQIIMPDSCQLQFAVHLVPVMTYIFECTILGNSVHAK